jgi:hypothetical protein
MPRLLRGVARTAVVAGTASAVSGRVRRRQAGRYAEEDAHVYAQRQAAYQNEVAAAQPAQAPPPAPSSSEDDVLSQLKALGDLRDQGILTDEEFDGQKAKILGS